MGLPLHAKDRSQPGRDEREEGYLHFLARESRALLRLLAIALVIITAAAMITVWFWAIVPATLLLMVCVLLFLTADLERRTETPADAERRPVDLQSAPASVVVDDLPEEPDPVEHSLVKRESRHVAALVACVGVAAVVLAFVVLPLKIAALAGLVLFCYMLLVSWPVWLSWIEDDIEGESDRLRQEQ